MSSNETPEIIIRGGDYEHTLGIPGVYSGVRLGYEAPGMQGLFADMLEHRCYEACEFSLANYLTLRATGQDWLTAVPIFPYRTFRHSLAVVRRDSALVSLAELAGKRVGVEDYSMTAAVWFRGLLEDEYGVDRRAIAWITRAKQRFPFPAGARVETTTRDLEELLSEGSIDAFLGMSLRDSALPPGERRLRPLLSDARREEEAYFERTSIYPIHHCVVIRNDMLDRVPALVDAVVGAYVAAKERAYRRQLGTTVVPWGKAHWASMFQRFSGDPLPYGLTPANRLVIERLSRYLHEQGFIPTEPVTDALFAVPSKQRE
jgi:4,5-dihydroxyphthalate decarboxylase